MAKVPTVAGIAANYKKQAARKPRKPKTIKIPTVEGILKEALTDTRTPVLKSGTLDNLIENAFREAAVSDIKKGGLRRKCVEALNKEASADIKKRIATAKSKKKITQKSNGPLVTTKRVEWGRVNKAGVEKTYNAASANLDINAIKGKKTRLWAAAKLFYQIVANTPVDEDYEYSRTPDLSREYRKNAFKLITGKDGKVSVTKVNTVSLQSPKVHKKDENVTRDNWVLKIKAETKATRTKEAEVKTVELKSGSLGIDFDQPSDTGWEAVADRIIKEVGKLEPTFVEITNNDPYIDVLEYGRYGKTSSTSKEQHKGSKYYHGTVGGYSVQAPRGIMRVAASQLNNLQLDRKTGERKSGQVSLTKRTLNLPRVTLAVNTDAGNGDSYSDVYDDIERYAEEFEREGKFVSERQLGEAFEKGLSTVEANIKEFNKRARALNTRRFNKAVKSGDTAKALEAAVKQQAERIERKQRAEANKTRKQAAHYWKEMNDALKEAGSFIVLISSPKTKVRKTAEEKPAEKEKFEITDEIKETYFLLFVETDTDVVKFLVKMDNGKYLFAKYKDEYDRYTNEKLLKVVESARFITFKEAINTELFEKQGVLSTDIKQSIEDENLYGLF